MAHQPITKLRAIQDIGQVVQATQSQIDFSTLKQECQLFTRYLIDESPHAYVQNKYHEAHRVSDMFHTFEANSFDALLLKIAIIHPFTTKLVDTYASFFARQSVVRKKIILLLAILESCNPTYAHFDKPASGNLATLGLKTIQHGVIFGFTMVMALICLLPLNLLFTVNAKGIGRGA